MKTRGLFVVALLGLLISPNARAQGEFPIGAFVSRPSLSVADSANLTWLVLCTDFDNNSIDEEYYTNSFGMRVIPIRYSGLYEPSRAQRLEIQAEKDPSPTLMWNYFQNRDVGQPDGNAWKADPLIHNAGYMARNPVPNNEYYYRRTSYFASFRMKIKKSGVPTKQVATLSVVDELNNTTSRILYDSDFPDNNYRIIELPFTLTPSAQGQRSTPGLLTGSSILSDHQVDVRVYWHDQVITYLDYVLIDDAESKALFRGDYNASIDAEANKFKSAATYPLVRRLRLNDEPFINGFLPFKYVDDRLKAVNPDGLAEGRGRAWTAICQRYQRFLVDTDAYELAVDYYPIRPHIPSPSISDATADSLGIARYSNGGNYTIYTTRLQNALDSLGSYSAGSDNFGLRPAIEAAKGTTPPRAFWNIPQLHGLLYRQTGKYAWLRNPTPNEIRAMVYMALVYGAKGIIYYPYGTFYDRSSDNPVDWNWNTGLLRLEQNPEDLEYYHDSNYATFSLSSGSRSIFTGYKEKWNEVKNLNAKLKTLGSTLPSLTWQNAASIHKSQIGNLSQVIKYLYTLKANNQQDAYPSSTYAEAGHMKDGRNWDYLMVVNRRCAPTQGSIDDRRKMKIQLNKGTGNWAVSQVPSGEYWTLPYNGWLTTSLFDPGEGRLYRVAPSVIYVPQNFATIGEALEVAMGGQTVQVAAGTYNESNNLTVKAGVTLQLSPGVTLKLANGKKLTVNGSISANGTSSQKITFQSISGTWYGIEVNYGGYTPLNYCIIKNATCGIRAYQTSNLYVENCEITNNTSGITFANQSSGYVRYSKINSNLGNSGINCSQNSNPIIRSYNQLKNNAPAGLYGDYNSLPELGSWANYGNNSISNSHDDVWSENSNAVYALYNYWGSSSPNPGVSSNVVWQPYLTFDPTGGGLLKPLADNAPLVLDNTAADTTGKSEFARAYLVYLSGDYATALVLFKELVTKYPETAAGLQALALIDHCYQNLDNAIASLSYLTQVNDSYTDKEISGLAQSITVGHLVKLGSYQEAIAKSEQILQAFPDKDLAKYALYDLGTIYWFFLADHKTGESYYRQLIAKYPDDDLSISALATLGEWQPGSQPKPEAQPLLAENKEVPAEFRLDQNYPNPFNPETTIRYHLAEASPVTIKIYNLLGAEVITLVDQIQLQGDHAIQWNGRDRFGTAVANGVYWLRLHAGNFVGQRKLVVLR